MQTDPGFALSLVTIVAVVYLLVLRLIDLNEKEPLWALSFALFVGAVVGAIAHVVVPPDFRTLSMAGGALTSTVGTAVAIAIAVAGLEGVGRARGWSEINGLVDGVVYGAAAGLGYATGEAFYRELSIGIAASDLTGETSSFGILWTTVLDGLSLGLFGAILGAGVGAALSRAGGAERVMLPLGALAAAFFVSWGYQEFAAGNALSGTQAVVRAWIALILPIALLVALVVYGLRHETSAIAAELSDEARSGTVTDEEFRMLCSPGARRAEYFRRITRGDLEGWLALRALHNRQVQLALTERRARGERDEAARAEVGVEIANLRRAVDLARQRLAPTGAARPASPEGAVQ